MVDNVASDRVVIGKISGVYGVKGWVKIHSFTEPMENFLGYKSVSTELNGRLTTIEFDKSHKHGKGLVGHIVGCDDRELARSYTRCELSVAVDELPALTGEEFYWRELEGLQVYSEFGEGEEVLLGAIHHLIETGANDVLVVRHCEHAIDDRERLIPYLPEQVVLDIDLEQRRMTVSWDPEF